jgi:hypothetical protein
MIENNLTWNEGFFVQTTKQHSWKVENGKWDEDALIAFFCSVDDFC